MIGFLLDDLSQSQLLSDLVRTGVGRDVAVMVRRVTPSWETPPFAVFNWADAWGARFPLVATDLDGAFHLDRFPATPVRLFYLADLEWLRHHRWGGPPPYKELAAVYRSSRLKLVCRSQAHARVVSRVWNVTEPPVCPRLDALYFEKLVHA